MDKLSTSVSIKHTYFPPWFSWMLRIIRSPETLWKGKRVLDKTRLSKPCRVYSITWNRRRVNIDALQKPHRLQAAGFFLVVVVVVASLQTPATDTADVLCTNNAVGCPSGAPRWPANPNAPPPPPPTPPPLANSYTQDARDKHSPVNWQGNPNYSVITQAQTR